VGYKGADYIPSDETPTAVMVEDIGGGSVAVDETACADECDAAVGCNAASYYGLLPEADWPAKKNCWLKTIAVPCVLPPDVQTETPLAMLIMKTTGEACALSPHLIAFILHHICTPFCSLWQHCIRAFIREREAAILLA
jgi:hypothetical protein